MLSRRTFLKAAGAATMTGPVARSMAAHATSTAPASANKIPRPTPAQVTWQDCEIGLLYSFDIPIAARRAKRDRDLFRDRRTCDPNLYNPQKLDTDQWMEAAKAAGAKYAVFTATHFNGFLQWQSDAYPYGLKQTRWRGGKADIVADFVASCRKAGIQPGLYLSTSHNIYQTVWEHYVNFGKGKGTPKQAAFNKVAEQMTIELCSRYGPLVQIWYDAGVKLPAEGGPDVLPIFDKYQPHSVFYNSMERSDHRWIGNELGHADYPCWATMPNRPGQISHNAENWKPLLAKGDPQGRVWSPGMVDVPLRGANKKHNWFWYPDQDDALHPTDTLVRMYDESVGRNCNLIMGEVITPDGLVPEADIHRLGEFGKAIRKRFGKAVATASGQGVLFEVGLPSVQKIDHVVMMEDIAQGERVREYVLEGKQGDRWITLARGSCIGHKRIDQFKPVEVSQVRLRCTAYAAEPIIRKLAIYGMTV